MIDNVRPLTIFCIPLNSHKFLDKLRICILIEFKSERIRCSFGNLISCFNHFPIFQNNIIRQCEVFFSRILSTLDNTFPITSIAIMLHIQLIYTIILRNSVMFGWDSYAIQEILDQLPNLNFLPIQNFFAIFVKHMFFRLDIWNFSSYQIRLMINSKIDLVEIVLNLLTFFYQQFSKQIKSHIFTLRNIVLVVSSVVFWNPHIELAFWREP